VRLQRGRRKRLAVHTYVDRVNPEVVRTVSRFLTGIALIGALASVVIAVFGLWLAIPHGDLPTNSTIDVFGLMKVGTTSVGIGLVALGIIGVVLTVRYVLNAFGTYFGPH
jgi:hypothetical protein